MDVKKNYSYGLHSFWVCKSIFEIQKLIELKEKFFIPTQCNGVVIRIAGFNLEINEMQKKSKFF